MDATFSIWWVISIGCLLLFILAALLRQRRKLMLNLGPQVVPRENVAPSKQLTALAALPQRLDQLVAVKTYGFNPLYVHDLRVYDFPEAQQLSQVPLPVADALRAAYAGGHAFGPDVSSLLRGDQVAKGKCIYFALINEPSGERHIAFAK